MDNGKRFFKNYRRKDKTDYGARLKLLKSEKVKNEYKELAITILSLYTELGVFFATVSVFIFDNTIMKDNTQ